jgi:uncharacterized protein
VVGRPRRRAARRTVARVTSRPASALYVGTVRHRRRRPSAHAFRYRTYHALLDLDELEDLDRRVRGFGVNRRALTGFRDRDHLGPRDEPVRAKLAAWLASRGVDMPDGPVRVLTNLRVLGHVFDPVSWWFCHHPDGSLALVVAEVHNTFGEAHGYVLDDLRRGAGDTLTAEATKAFHVSPFLPIDGLRYRFTFTEPGARVLAHVEVSDADGLVFDATQAGRHRPFTTRSLARVLVTHPLMPLRTVLAIHIQALRLWRRGTTFHRKPEPPPGGFDDVPTAEGSAPRDDRLIA